MNNSIIFAAVVGGIVIGIITTLAATHQFATAKRKDTIYGVLGLIVSSLMVASLAFYPKSNEMPAGAMFTGTVHFIWLLVWWFHNDESASEGVPTHWRKFVSWGGWAMVIGYVGGAIASSF